MATLGISEARRQIASFEKRLEDEPVIWVNRRGKTAFAVVNADVLRTALDAIEILSDPVSSQAIQSSLRDVRAGRLVDHYDVKRALLG